MLREHRGGRHVGQIIQGEQIVAEDVRLIGRGCERLAEQLHGLRRPPLLHANHGQVIGGLGSFGREADRLFEELGGRIRFAGRLFHDAERVVREGVIRLERDGPLDRRERFADMTEAHVGEAEEMPGLGVVGIGLNEGVEFRERFGIAARFEQELPQVSLGNGL